MLLPGIQWLLVGVVVVAVALFFSFLSFKYCCIHFMVCLDLNLSRFVIFFSSLLLLLFLFTFHSMGF